MEDLPQFDAGLILSHRDNYVCFAANDLAVNLVEASRIETSCDCVSVSIIEYEDRSGQIRPLIQAYFPTATSSDRVETELIIQCQGFHNDRNSFNFEIECVLINNSGVREEENQ